MSAEAVGVATIWKPIIWVVGGLLALIKGLLIYIWVDSTKKTSQNTKDLRDFKSEVSTQYYSREHVDLIITPIKESLDRNTAATEKLHDAITELVRKR